MIWPLIFLSILCIGFAAVLATLESSAWPVFNMVGLLLAAIALYYVFAQGLSL